MKGLKTTTISILAIGLLAGSAVGVAAQGEEAEPVEFVQFLEFGFSEETFEDWNGGVFGGFGDIPGGSASWFSGTFDGQRAAGTFEFDPGEPGGDTFVLSLVGEDIQVLDEEAGSWTAEGTWDVQLGSGTGDYEGLKGEGRMYIAASGPEEDLTMVVAYTGSVGTDG